MNLCRNGESAKLSMQCDHGKATINLQLNLQQYPPSSFRPYPPPPRQHPRPYQQPRPSRLRRSARRAQAQNEKIAKTAGTDATEQVVTSSCSLKSAEKADNCDVKVQDKSEKDTNKSQDDATDIHVQQLAEQAFPDQPKNDLNSVYIQSACTEEGNDDDFVKQNGDDERTKIMNYMEDFKNSLTAGLRQSVRQSVQLGVQDAFKPP